MKDSYISKASILIVEDNFIVMMEIKDRLMELGYNIADTASSGEEALQKAAKHLPDLTLMDIRLKGEMDGIEAASRIKKELDIPVIYLTAHTDDDTLQRAKLTEPYGYIIKPFEERELRSIIEMALYKHEMERKLKESEHWLSATLNSIGDALIATDSKGIVKFLNPVAEEILGRKQNDAHGHTIEEIFILQEENGSVIENPVSITLSKNCIVGGSSKILSAFNGRKTAVDFSSAPIRDQKNSIAGVVLVFRDITERKRAKELIEKQRIFLKQIIDTDPNYITVKNAQGKFELTNKALAEALGTNPEDIMGKNDTQYFTPEEIEYQRKIELEVLNFHKEIFNPEEKLIDSQGKVHLLQTFRRAIDSKDKDEKLVLSIGADITELKLTEKILRESEERIKILFQAIPDMVFRYLKNGVIIDCHIKEHDLLVLPADTIIGERIDKIFEKPLADKILSLSEKASATNLMQISEYQAGVNQGMLFKEIRVVNSGSGEFIVIFRDITQYKKARIQIEKYLEEVQETKRIVEQKASELAELNKKLNESEKELRNLNASKDKFFSIIAHDLRSPFTALLGLSEHLVNEIDSVTKEELASIADNILKSAKLTFNLLENLLQWARIKTGKIKFEPENINLKIAVEEMIDLYNSNIESKLLKTRMDVDDGIIVFADLNMFRLILRNLLSNSIKFTDKNGRIAVSAQDEKGFVTVKVSDSGVGMQPEKIEKLFQIDQNISTSGTNNEEGTGLGLILCKEFIEINKGKISVNSIPGEGSEFSFTLPDAKKG